VHVLDYELKKNALQPADEHNDDVVAEEHATHVVVELT